jgi:hypothetical protein
MPADHAGPGIVPRLIARRLDDRINALLGEPRIVGIERPAVSTAAIALTASWHPDHRLRRSGRSVP